MSSPRVLVIGEFHPDSFVRWIADGFVYAGCKVVRCGVHSPGPWPEDERPRIMDIPGYAPGRQVDVKVPLDLGAIRGHFATERNFTADLLFVDLWTGVSLTSAAGSGTVALRHAGDIAYVRDGQGVRGTLLPGVDLYTFHDVGASRRPDETVVAPSSRIATVPDVVVLPPTIGEQAAVLQRCDRAIVFSDAEIEFALKAIACGVIVRTVGADASWVAKEFGTAHYPDVEHLRASRHGGNDDTTLDYWRAATRHTWRHRAIEVLSHFDLRPGPVPRL